MGHVVRNKPWGIIDINTSSGLILFQERWQYVWTTTAGQVAWTPAEKRRFHRQVDVQVWNAWSNRIKLSASGAASFCTQHPKAKINFDIKWVTANAHWTVNVRKLPPGSTPTTYISNVDRPNRQVNLDSGDLSSYRPCNAAAVCRGFKAVPHEFGHTFPGINDEYGAGHANLADSNSMMNIGDEIRARHLGPILGELNTMIPNCTFSYP